MKIKHVVIATAFAVLCAAAPRPAAAAPVSIKLATLVPDGSLWQKALVDMGDDWSKATAGRVTLRIYPGGVAGDEPDMVRKMRIGQLQAAALTVRGLAELDDGFEVFTVPMMYQSYDELFAVLDRMEPTLKKRLDAKGFMLLSWGHAGWVYFFSKQPVQSMADLKKLKLWVWTGDDKMTQMWKESGYQPVPLSPTDILTGLNTGMIDGLPTVPLGALSLQWFRTTKFMLDEGLSPLVGGIVITKQAWNKIPEADRAAVLAGCKKAEDKLKKIIPDQDKNALVEMQKRGLTVTHMKPEAEAEFKKETEAFVTRMRGTIVPPEMLDLAIKERNAYRQQSHR